MITSKKISFFTKDKYLKSVDKCLYIGIKSTLFLLTTLPHAQSSVSLLQHPSVYITLISISSLLFSSTLSTLISSINVG